MTTQLVNARIDTGLKADVDDILAGLGMTGAEAIRMFYTQIRNQRGIPFSLALSDVPNAKTRQAMNQANSYLAGDKTNSQTFDNVDEFSAWLDKEV